MWKVIFKHRILLFHPAESFLLYLKMTYHVFQILESKMERILNRKCQLCLSKQSFMLCFQFLSQQLTKITILWELSRSNQQCWSKTTNVAMLISSAFKTQGKVCFWKERFLLFLVSAQFSSVSALLNWLLQMLFSCTKKPPSKMHLQNTLLPQDLSHHILVRCIHQMKYWHLVNSNKEESKGSFISIFARLCEHIASRRLQNTLKRK